MRKFVTWNRQSTSKMPGLIVVNHELKLLLWKLKMLHLLSSSEWSYRETVRFESDGELGMR